MTGETEILHEETLSPSGTLEYTVDEPHTNIEMCCETELPTFQLENESHIINNDQEPHLTPLAYCCIGVLTIATITIIILAIKRHRKKKN